MNLTIAHITAVKKLSLGIVPALMLATLLSSGSLQADTSVWEISRGDARLYLGGTVHLLRPDDYPLPPEYEQAYEDSDQIVFETDINVMGDLATQTRMLQQLTYADERTLQTVLNDEAYTALEEYTAQIGMPLAMMQKFKPGMVVSTLQVIKFQSMGFTPEGVDSYFNAKAVGDAKELGALESIDEQIGFLANMGEGSESEFILMSLEDMEETDAVMEEMLTAWREGDLSTLSALFVDDMRREAPALYDSLLKQRNINWLPQIEAMLDDGDREFVLVGTAHLVGDEGLLHLLEEKGYGVRQL